MDGLKNLFVIGDSISIHYEPYLKQMLKGIFNYDRKRGAGDLSPDLDHPTGANGGDSRMVLAYLEESLQKGARYEIILINCGLHDIKTDPVTFKKQVGLDEYQSNLREIIKRVGQSGIQPVWIRTTPVDTQRHNRLMTEFIRFNQDVITYNEAADRLMDQSGIPVIDLYTFTVNLGEDIYCDHVHFTEKVRAMQAAFITGYLLGSRGLCNSSKY